MADKQTVWDGGGRKCVVDPIDAKEIVAQGGSWSDPNAVETHPVTIHNNEDTPEVKPKAKEKVAFRHAVKKGGLTDKA